jgi:hypothetical protein
LLMVIQYNTAINYRLQICKLKFSAPISTNSKEDYHLYSYAAEDMTLFIQPTGSKYGKTQNQARRNKHHSTYPGIRQYYSVDSPDSENFVYNGLHVTLSRL